MVSLGRTLIPVWFLLLFLTPRAFADTPVIEPVTGFDVNRYLGKWYEIARFPASFEKGWVNVTTTYTLRDDGKLKVENEGRQDTSDGKRLSVAGKARFAGGEDTGAFRISFYWVLSYDYTIIALDPEYTCAMVASSKDYLWILAREPKPDPAVLESMIQKAREMGFNTDKLTFTSQEWESPAPERPQAVIPR
jgi:apolipoprotein D and lipocalin family protein